MSVSSLINPQTISSSGSNLAFLGASSGGLGGGLGQYVLTNQFGGGSQGALVATSLNGNGGFGSSQNLGSTLLLSSALGSGSGNQLASSGVLGGGLGQHVLANQFGGGLQGALVATSLNGNGGFGSSQNLGSTLLLANALGSGSGNQLAPSGGLGGGLGSAFSGGLYDQGSGHSFILPTS